MPQSQLWAIAVLAAVALCLSRYRCLLHPERLLRFERDHWVCPQGHETLLAYDCEAEEPVELRSNGVNFGAYPI